MGKAGVSTTSQHRGRLAACFLLQQRERVVLASTHSSRTSDLLVLVEDPTPTNLQARNARLAIDLRRRARLSLNPKHRPPRPVAVPNAVCCEGLQVNQVRKREIAGHPRSYHSVARGEWRFTRACVNLFTMRSPFGFFTSHHRKACSSPSPRIDRQSSLASLEVCGRREL